MGFIECRIIELSDKPLHKVIISFIRIIVNRHINSSSHIRRTLSPVHTKSIVDREICLSDREIKEHVGSGIRGGRAIERHRILGTVGSVPCSVHNRILGKSTIETDIRRGELGPVGIAGFNPDIVSKIWSQ